MPAKLTPKQKKFIDEYLIDLNATQAAIRAGYSEKTARAAAARNMQNVYIQEALQEARQRQQERTGITADRVLKELADIALDDASDVSDSRLRYSNKLKALELLGKHLGIFERGYSGDDSGRGEGGVIVLPEVEDV